MKRKITSLAGAMAVTGGVVIVTVAAATGQASEADRGGPASVPTPHATVVFVDRLADSDLAASHSELAVGRRTPRA